MGLSFIFFRYFFLFVVPLFLFEEILFSLGNYDFLIIQRTLPKPFQLSVICFCRHFHSSFSLALGGGPI